MLTYFINASLPVQLLMLLLVSISVLSWTFIFKQNHYLRNEHQQTLAFINKFWHTENLLELYNYHKQKRSSTIVIAMFTAGFRSYVNLAKGTDKSTEAWQNSLQRSMFVEFTSKISLLERHLNFLATAGSISPYIGLLGTVWGIMHTLQALGSTEHATIAMVAPGISEALVATALGLFAAIPAVIYYNKFQQMIDNIEQQCGVFREEFISLTLKQLDNL